MTRIRKSIPTEGASMWWASGWSYVMPDFDKPNHSIVEFSQTIHGEFARAS